MYNAPNLGSYAYLPSEEVNKRNFPEIAKYQSEISVIFVYAKLAETALINFINSKADKIDLNPDELNSCIDLTRRICSALGYADNVCYDVLVKLRGYLYMFQQVKYTADKYGTTYVGTPSSTSGGIG